MGFSIGDSISIKTPNKEGILSPFQVAVRNAENNRIEVLKNTNSLIWWKFNREAIQLDLKAGDFYKFTVDGWLGLRNLIDFEKQSPPTKLLEDEKS